MILSRRRFLAVTAAAAGFTGRADAAEVWQGRAFGAPARITLNGPRDLARAALTDCAATVRRIEALFSLHDPGSALCRLNREGHLAPAPPEMTTLFALCTRLHDATGGAFDPTVQPLWQALANGGDLQAARDAIGWGRLRSDGDAIRLAPGQALTLNGIAQGYGADMIRAALARRGFADALVDLGEFAALGGPWSVAIEDPVSGPVATRHLTGNAIATSSPAAMRLSETETHILGPHGEQPLWSTVSVEADSAALADGLSTALCLIPAARFTAIRASLPRIGRITTVTPGGDIAAF